MKIDLNSTDIRQSNQTGADPGSLVPGIDSLGQAESPGFHVRTGVQAGGFVEDFYAWWGTVTQGFNLFDQSE